MSASPADGPSDEADEYDRLRRRVLWAMPYGLYVLGARAGDRLNGMTINFVSQMGTAPRKLVGVGIQKEAFTHALVTEGGVFSVNFVARDDRAIVRKFVKPVEVDVAVQTLNGFGFHRATTGAPVLDIAVAFLDCAVVDSVDAGDHTWFVGDVVDCGFQRPEDTPVLRMEDTRMNYGG